MAKNDSSFLEVVGGFAFVVLIGAIVYRRLGLRIDGLSSPAQTPEERLNDTQGDTNQK